MSASDRLSTLAFRLSMETAGRWALDRLLRAAEDPERAQQRTLGRILRSCCRTELGEAYGLSALEGADPFRDRVPISDYEALREPIARQIATGRRVVSPAPPILYARTSGTTGAPKYIPVTAAALRGLKRAQRAMAFVQHAELDAFHGRVLGIGGARCEELLGDGTPAGSATGLIYETMPRLLRAKYVVPPETFAIEDYDLKYAVLARLAARAGDVSAIATANPSTVLRLLEIFADQRAAILREMRDGAAPLLDRLPPDIIGAFVALRRPDPARAAVLEAIAHRGEPIGLAALWPGLRAVVTWLGGGCAHAAERVRGQLPPAARMIDAGYVASEMRGTVVVDAARGLALPLLEDVFFEFMPVEAWDRGLRDTLLLHELEEGRDYHVIVSTEAGLLRYHMNDVLRAGPRIGRTPSLAFLRKGRGAANITGEKLTEDQLHLAMAEAARAIGARSVFHLALARPALSRYSVFVGFDGAPPDPLRFANLLDRALAALNIEYAAKRRSGRLKPLEVVLLLPGAGEAYRRHCMRKGQRESQLKVLALQAEEDCDFDFQPHLAVDAPVAIGDR
jgi:hypothetical protein